MAAPVVVLVLAGRSPRSAARVIVGAAMVVAILRTVAIVAGRSPAEVYLVTWFRIDGVLLGVAAAYLHRQLVVTERQQLHRSATPALSVLAGAVVFVPSWSGWPGPSLVFVVPLVSVATFVVVLAIATRSASATVLRVLSAPVLRWIGVRSLSLYLWHYVVGVLLVAGGADHGWDGPGLLARQLGFTAVAALASYEFVERPAARYLLSHPTPPWRR